MPEGRILALLTIWELRTRAGTITAAAVRRCSAILPLLAALPGLTVLALLIASLIALGDPIDIIRYLVERPSRRAGIGTGELIGEVAEILRQLRIARPTGSGL